MSGGRSSGTPNYKNNLLVDCVENILPVSTEEWHCVSHRYKTISGETIDREPLHVKRNFIEKCCLNFKKPTGSSKALPMVERAQRAYEKILKKSNQTVAGASSDEELAEDEEETESSESSEAEAEADVAINHDEDVPTSEVSVLAASGAAPFAAPRKRKLRMMDNKTKNSRPSNSRNNIAKQISLLIEKFPTTQASNTNENSMVASMMQMMVMFQQQQQQQMQMLKMMMPVTSSSTTLTFSSSTSSSI